MSILPPWTYFVLVATGLMIYTLPFADSQRPGPSGGMFQAIHQVINQEKLKQRIMRGLNLTTNQVNVPGRPRDLATHPDRKEDFDHVEPTYQPQTLTIFSVTSGPATPDSLNFVLDSQVRAVADAVDTVKLVLHAWDDRRKRKRGKSRRRARQKIRKELAARATFESQMENARHGSGGELSKRLSRAKSAAHTKKRPKRKSLELRQRYKMKLARRWQRRTRIKIVVKVLRPKLKRKRRIAVGKIKVQRYGRTTVNLKLPKEMIAEASRSADHTLSLQVLCKRCGQHIHLDRVLVSSATGRGVEDEGRLWLNPYRPYLFVQYSGGSSGARPEARVRREASNQLRPLTDIHGRKPWDASVSEDCCSERVWITFEELGLSELILYPEGFISDICLGSCLATTQASTISSSSPYMPSSLRSPSSALPLPQNTSVTVRPHKLSTQTGNSGASVLHPMHPQPGGQPVMLKSPAESRRGPPSMHSCVPLHTRPLLVWYIHPLTNEIIPKDIPGLIQESCGFNH